jgi:hypothetical protein
MIIVFSMVTVCYQSADADNLSAIPFHDLLLYLLISLYFFTGNEISKSNNKSGSEALWSGGMMGPIYHPAINILALGLQRW